MPAFPDLSPVPLTILAALLSWVVPNRRCPAGPGEWQGPRARGAWTARLARSPTVG